MYDVLKRGLRPLACLLGGGVVMAAAFAVGAPAAGPPVQLGPGGATVTVGGGDTGAPGVGATIGGGGADVSVGGGTTTTGSGPGGGTTGSTGSGPGGTSQTTGSTGTGGTTKAGGVPGGATGDVASRPAGAIRLPSGAWSIPASSVRSPYRLVLSKVRFDRTKLFNWEPFSVQVLVKDTRGYVVRGAKVAVARMPELAPTNLVATTAKTGLGTLKLRPTRRLVFHRGGQLALFFDVFAVSRRAPTADHRLVRIRTTATPAL